MIFRIESSDSGPPRRKAWPWLLGFLLVAVACVLGANLLASQILRFPTGAENARNTVLDEEAPAIVRAVEVANPDPGNLGPASVALFRERFERQGDAVLASWSTPGRPPSGIVAGWIDVRMVRTADGNVWSPTGTNAGTATVCLRFETRWSDSDGAQYSFHRIKCP